MVGRLDPSTGDIKVKPTPTQHAVPYGIIVTEDGVPFFCEFGTNRLASIDPQSMAIREYPLPEGARPRRLALASDGTIYYSDYERGYLGHFDPKSQKQEEWPSPGGSGSEPYGITTTSNGMVWYSESGVNPNRWCASIRKPRPSPKPPFHQAAAWCATWSRPRTENSISLAVE